MQTYFEEDFFVIKYHKANQVIIGEWRIPPASEEFKNCMNVMIEALQHFNTGKVVFDTLALGVLLDTDQEWISSDWYKRAVKAGYSQVAFVLPPDVFTQMFVEETVNRTTDRIPTAYFEDRSAALDWITNSNLIKVA
jgi:hypothetical protein